MEERVRRIALIPGDGIGREVIAAGRQVLEVLAAGQAGLGFAFESFDWGSERYLSQGAMMPADGLESLKGFDAIYFGSAGDPRVPDHVSLWQLRLAICQGLDQYANIRPARLLPGPVEPAARRWPGGYRLAHRAREFRGRVFGGRRSGAPWPAAGSRRWTSR